MAKASAGAAAITKPIVTPLKDTYKAGKNLTKKSYEDDARKELFPNSTFKDKAKQSFAEAQEKWKNNNKTAAAFSALKGAGQGIKHILPFTSPYDDDQKVDIKNRAEEMRQQKKLEKLVSKETEEFVDREIKTNPIKSTDDPRQKLIDAILRSPDNK